MNNNSPDSLVELNPKPEITKINKIAFIILCGVIVIIVFVVAYSVSKATAINTSKPDAMFQPSLSGNDDKELWYYNVSNNSIIVKKPDENTHNIPQSESAVNVETLKKHDESLRSALESSIRAPNINNNNVLLNSSNNVTSQNASSLSMQNTNSDYLYSMVKKPLSPYEIKAGTIIPAVLIGGINSDLPGQLTALVSKNVFDTVNGRYLLIPQGSMLILQYDSRIAYGQERLLVAAKRLIFPNGNSLDLGGMPITDESGYAGFYDQVDNHYLRIFGSSGIIGLITGGFELNQSQKVSNVNNSSALQEMDAALGQQMGQASLGMMNKNLEIQPTIKIRPGREFNVTVTKDIIFPGQY